MTCCADDIRFLGFVCKYKDTASLKRRQWVMVTATFEWEYSDLYGEKGPVLRATEVLRQCTEGRSCILLKSVELLKLELIKVNMKTPSAY